jgi:hypothetical protein
MSFHVLVPGHGIPDRVGILQNSINSIFNGVPSSFSKSCTIYTYNDIAHRIPACDYINMKGLWTDFMVDFIGKSEKYTYVSILIDDVVIPSQFDLTVVYERDINIWSPSIKEWHWKNMQPSKICTYRKADKMDILFVVMKHRYFQCFAKQINLKLNHIGWGYDLTLSKECGTDIIIDDTQSIVHNGEQTKTRTYNTDSGLDQLWKWMRFKMKWDCENELTCMPLLIQYQNMNTINCLDFLDEMKLNFIDTAYFKSVTHNGGWGTIMNAAYNRYHDSSASVAFIDCSEHYFLWERNELKSPWMGIVHFVDDLPTNIYPRFETLSGLILSDTFQSSLRYCLGLVVLSKHSAFTLRKFKLQVPIRLLRHPIGMDCDTKKINSVPNQIENVVLLGQQYRRISTIFHLKTTKNKIWLPGMHPESQRLKQMMQRENLDPVSMNVSIRYVKNDEYSRILDSSIVVIDLWDASANNAVLDAISCSTPVLVRKLPAVVEYLGRSYPLYFHEISDLNNLIETITREDLQKAKNYIDHIDRRRFSIENFLNSLQISVQSLVSA